MVISVAGNAALARVVEPRKDLRHEIGLLVRAAAGRKFRDPDLAPAARCFGLGHMVFEVGHAVVRRKPIPMDGDEIDRAVPASAEEAAQPFEAHISIVAIAHGRRTELGFAGVGFQVSGPRFDRRFWREIGLCR